MTDQTSPSSPSGGRLSGWSDRLRAKLAGRKPRAEKRTDDDKSADKNSQPKRTKRQEARETIESVLIAFILAFLFRTFEAEAFVIPTGSMAPTLRGRHKEADCPQCGHRVVVGASQELDRDTGKLKPDQRVHSAACPNCRFRVPMKDQPVFGGDRILVTKYSYELSDPDRWDVFVFKYPVEPGVNYIKRVVGLPGDQLFIAQGDLFASHQEDGPIEILRKSPRKQRAIQIPVYDNNHPETLLHEMGWPQRWAPMTQSNAETAVGGWIDSPQGVGWNIDSEQRTLSLSADRAKDWQWVRYRHYVPSDYDWAEAQLAKQQGRPANFDLDKALQLVNDFCGYNATYSEKDLGSNVSGYFWVGDLTIECELTVTAVEDGAAVRLELNEGPTAYRCEIDLATGQATLSYPDPQQFGPGEPVTLGTAETDIIGTGSWELAFANVDDRLCLWVDGSLVEFSTDNAEQPHGAYQRTGGVFTRVRPTQADRLPIGVAAKHSSLTLGDLLVKRDLYYVADQLDIEDYNSQFYNPSRNFEAKLEEAGPNRDSLNLDKNLHQPDVWWNLYRYGKEEIDGIPIEELQERQSIVRFDRLKPGQYFAMGDNSPASQDSRFWVPLRDWKLVDMFARERFAVPREALIGKAFYIYWPHGVPFMNDGKGWGIREHQATQPEHEDARGYHKYRVPFYPDFSRMKRIR